MSEPRLLILETSGRVGQVALACGERLLRGRRLDEARRHARDLAPAVADLLGAEGWRPRDVDAVIVSRGPGSYTGLRVGVMAAKAFAYATGAALVAVETFEAIAAQAPPDVLAVDVVADAQQGKVYAQHFRRETPSGPMAPATPLAIRPLGPWLASRDASALVSGPGVRAYRERIPADMSLLSPDAWDPVPASLLRLGLAHYRAGRRDNPYTLEPLYLRPSAAEEQAGAK
jgi:tRNA threonylcarbamoyladenosine biosynthesis protein TsaB